MSARGYLPLSEYGLLGNGQGAALLARDGSIDWACFPRFDSPAVFSRILDEDRGGFWQIAPEEGRSTATFSYLGATAVLETVYESASGIARVVDAAPAPSGRSPGSLLIRVCEGLGGTAELTSVFEPRFDYGAREPVLAPVAQEALRAQGAGDMELLLLSSVGQQDREAHFSLEPGERAIFVLAWGHEGDSFRLSDALASLEKTEAWWNEWAGACAYAGPYREPVVRSAVTLKLLTYLPSGATVAAPSMSLPEILGGSANWDYRYAWLRDSSLVQRAWLALGQEDEAAAFFDWICARVGHPSVPEDGLRVMYDVDGGSDHAERELHHLSGYAESRPVRVGNDACRQTQLDVYGDVFDCFAHAPARDRRDRIELWTAFRPLADWICAHWSDSDHGIWEVRGEQRHYVYSKVKAWVALDRAVRSARDFELDADTRRWSRTTDEIRDTVLRRGWSDRLGAFKQSFEDEAVDAANLLIPLSGFIPAHDRRALMNLQQIEERLRFGDLVYRRVPDPHPDESEEGAFTICSFWIADALAAAGRMEEAGELFESLLSRASPLGLYSEEVDPAGGRALGNLPQAFTHAALVSTAITTLDGSGRLAPPEGGEPGETEQTRGRGTVPRQPEQAAASPTLPVE